MDIIPRCFIRKVRLRSAERRVNSLARPSAGLLRDAWHIVQMRRTALPACLDAPGRPAMPTGSYRSSGLRSMLGATQSRRSQRRMVQPGKQSVLTAQSIPGKPLQVFPASPYVDASPAVLLMAIQ